MPHATLARPAVDHRRFRQADRTKTHSLIAATRGCSCWHFSAYTAFIRFAAGFMVRIRQCSTQIQNSPLIYIRCYSNGGCLCFLGTGRITRTNKRGSITSDLPPILERLGIGEETWLILSCEFEDSFSQWVGSEAAIRRATRNVGKTRSRSPPIPAG